LSAQAGVQNPPIGLDDFRIQRSSLRLQFCASRVSATIERRSWQFFLYLNKEKTIEQS
jgi:hypothetical protein